MIGVDIEDTKLDLARQLGADYVVNARTARPRRRQSRILAAPTSPFPSQPRRDRSSRRSAHSAAAADWFVSRSPADDKMTIPIFDTVLGGKSIIGSIVGTRQDLADVFALHMAGRTKVIGEERQLDDVNAGADDVLASRVPARVVFTF